MSSDLLWCNPRYVHSHDVQGSTVSRSFLKWAGGKHKVADSLLKLLNERRPHEIDWSVKPGQRYHEPMLGSGSMYFRLKHSGFIDTRKQSFLSDINEILMTAMGTVADKNLLPDLKHKLDDLQRLYPSDLPHPNPRNQTKSQRERRMFYKKRRELNQLMKNSRKLSPEEKIRASSLAIFLNKTCFNGLWRMNSKGEFNTPEGAYDNPKNIFQNSILDDCHGFLRSSRLFVQDWRTSLKQAKRGDLVYVDPPYLPINLGGSTFTDYHSSGFTMEDQVELAESLTDAATRGIRIIASNHDTTGNPNVREIYNNAANGLDLVSPEIHSIDVSRTINCKGEGRVKVREVLIFIKPEF